MVVHLDIGLRSINRDQVDFYVGFHFLGDKLTAGVMEAAFFLPLWKEGRLQSLLCCGTGQRLSPIEY